MDEVVHVGTQIAMTSDDKIQKTRLEQMARIYAAEIDVMCRVERDARENRNAQAELDVDLAHVRIHSA